MTKKKPKPTPQVAGKDYPPGHFTALIRLHDWPPQWQPKLVGLETQAQVIGQEIARKERWKGAAEGKGWAKGTVVLPNTPKNPLPAWMVRRAL